MCASGEAAVASSGKQTTNGTQSTILSSDRPAQMDARTSHTPPCRHSPPGAEVERLASGPPLRRRHSHALQPPRIQPQPLRVLLYVVEPAVLQATAGAGTQGRG